MALGVEPCRWPVAVIQWITLRWFGAATAVFWSFWRQLWRWRMGSPMDGCFVPCARGRRFRACFAEGSEPFVRWCH